MMFETNYYNAIVVVSDPETKVLLFKKYHDIKKGNEQRFRVFIKKKFPAARYVNYYEKSNKLFAVRVYL